MSRGGKRPTAASAYSRFLMTLRFANAAAVELRVQHHRFSELLARNHHQPEMLGHFADSVFRWYITWAVVGTRRLMDQSSDSRSFRSALDYIGNPENGVKSFGGEPINVAETHQDRGDLIRLSEDIIAIANKCLAHSIEDANVFEVSMSKLTDAIHKIESLSIKYMALVTGVAVLARDDGSTIQGKIAGTALPVELVGSAWPIETTMPNVNP